MSQTTEVDQWTREGHERFKRMTRFHVEIDPDGPGVQMSWDEWMEWQMTRDPIEENPVLAEQVRAKLVTPKVKGPGISKRTTKKKATPNA